MASDIVVDEIVLLCAVRYALGRRTYVPAALAGQVRQAWEQLTPSARTVIRTDVDVWLRDRSAATAGPQARAEVDIVRAWEALHIWMGERP